MVDQLTAIKAAPSIRFAVASDIPALHQLIGSFVSGLGLGDKFCATESLLHESLFGARPATESLVAEHKGAAVGFVTFTHNFSVLLGRRGLWLEDIFVDVGHRQRGIGRNLFQRLAQIAVERGCARLEWSAEATNTDALKFFQAMGAECQAGWENYRLDQNKIEALARR